MGKNCSTCKHRFKSMETFPCGPCCDEALSSGETASMWEPQAATVAEQEVEERAVAREFHSTSKIVGDKAYITIQPQAPEGSKETNPKDAIGSGKLPMDIVPDTVVAYLATAYLEGALKYGKTNWRVAGVRSSIYLDACRRHLAKYKNGQDTDPKTKVHHLASAMACLGIILDAELCGKLTDDRPPKAPVDVLIDGMEATVGHLKELFKDHNPKHHTIADSQ